MNAIPFSPFGVDLFGDVIRQPDRGALAERFEFPPFSVLNARDGNWQERKRAWLALGIEGEIGRGQNLLDGGHVRKEENQAALAEKYGRNVETLIDGAAGLYSGATSIFDPVVTELAYRWFCPPAGQIVDPFAGGSVRGIVAGLLGFSYLGIDLRHEQIQANEAQREVIAPESDVTWVMGDSMQMLEQAPEADFIFSCPPYGDLERYSDDPLDLSTMEYPTFLAAYKRIILRCMKSLKNDRFACFVVGDFRDPKSGHYRGFVADTIKAFGDVGMGLYNEAILVTSVGSLPVRVSSQFEGSRKLGKTHQNVLVFCKGDWRKAAQKCIEP